MSIKLNRLRLRKSVVWLATDPPEDARHIFTEREYLVRRCSDAELHDKAVVEGISAVVFARTQEGAEGIVTALRAHAKRLLDFDVNIIVRTTAEDLSSVVEAINELKIRIGGVPLPEAENLEAQKDQPGDPPAPCAQYFSEEANWASIANFVSDNAAGPAPNSILNIVFDGSLTAEEEQKVLTDSVKLLLQRAFWN